MSAPVAANQCYRAEFRCAYCLEVVPVERLTEKVRCPKCHSTSVFGVLAPVVPAPLEDKHASALRLVRALAQELEERTRGGESRHQLRAAIHGYCMEIERHASRALR